MIRVLIDTVRSRAGLARTPVFERTCEDPDGLRTSYDAPSHPGLRGVPLRHRRAQNGRGPGHGHRSRLIRTNRPGDRDTHIRYLTRRRAAPHGAARRPFCIPTSCSGRSRQARRHRR
ncbi:MAG: hypothetical protein AVDCRST_MAG64-2433 [uncultured Phycisphaerae bacterium]|uniref:Uncharacterized protein n=1 Tax=uncultured Phycisphaerae bacterium TaxID=904963 RepID=A0A6J4PDH4_9BACT|nr:MAG: hypothetical protein AVDCRST_MAG64-2433 [uncultured Phycisphaerae bacterium]